MVGTCRSMTASSPLKPERRLSPPRRNGGVATSPGMAKLFEFLLSQEIVEIIDRLAGFPFLDNGLRPIGRNLVERGQNNGQKIHVTLLSLLH